APRYCALRSQAGHPRPRDYGLDSAPLVSLAQRLASRAAKPTSTPARTANMLRCHRFNGVPPSFRVAWSEIEMLIPSSKPHAVELQSPAIPTTLVVASAA